MTHTVLMLRLLLVITWTTICTRAQLVALLFPGSSVTIAVLGKPCHTEAYQGVCVKIEQCGSAFSIGSPAYCGPTPGFDVGCCGNPTSTADVLDVSLPDVINPEVNEQASRCHQRCGIRLPTCRKGECILPTIVSESTFFPENIKMEEERKLRMEEISRYSGKFSGILSRIVRSEARTVAGGFEPTPNTWPWMALLGFQMPDGSPNWQCGGTVIRYGQKHKWIITAAHCFNKGPLDIVRLGEHNYTDVSQTITSDHWIEKRVVHPEYSIRAGYHDMALIKLSRFPTDIKKINMNPMVSPICLPWGEKISEKVVGEQAYVAGWGATEYDGSKSPVLQEGHVTIFHSSICDENYKKGVSWYETHYPDGIQAEYLLCAGHPDGGVDACKGDSGGPLMIKRHLMGSINGDQYYLTGVVSHAYGCGLKEYPGLYTPLHNPAYLAWIKKVAFNPGETDSFC